ncbi:hypothetical protein CDA63_14035 [Hymenobacter amundsenii]|uniref:Outer membrane protein beta-barrel domain-containing protein n=1 Tax=Hymenobacter amundsenii TaxID=2006685 RepID=A0A246FJ01_9BACT|nr:porin family protein [Hymenobacter amundsenii]OWP62510.1 hypothetical protein CDA63_14035 [Hymenobacter amundsenii]
MKKLLFSFSLLAVAAGFSTAQAQRNVSLGLKGGASLSNFVGKQADGYSNLVGFHGGLFANIGLTRMVAFQPELLYSRKGAKVPALDLIKRVDYLDVPLAFHVNADGLFFEAGPQVGFLISAKDKIGNRALDSKNNYSSVDLGYLFGLGYQRKTGPGIGLRYNGVFTNVGKSTKLGNVTIQDNVRNSVFQLYLTYSFQGR